MNKPASKFKFSEALRELEEITTYLESSEVDLDEALRKFERGSELAKQLESHLKKAETVVKTIKT